MKRKPLNIYFKSAVIAVLFALIFFMAHSIWKKQDVKADDIHITSAEKETILTQSVPDQSVAPDTLTIETAYPDTDWTVIDYRYVRVEVIDQEFFWELNPSQQKELKKLVDVGKTLTPPGGDIKMNVFDAPSAWFYLNGEIIMWNKSIRIEFMPFFMPRLESCPAYYSWLDNPEKTFTPSGQLPPYVAATDEPDYCTEIANRIIAVLTYGLPF